MVELEAVVVEEVAVQEEKQLEEGEVEEGTRELKKEDELELLLKQGLRKGLKKQGEDV